MTEHLPPPAPQHPPPTYPQPYYWSPPTNGFAIASLICGIVGMGVGSILALVFGYVAKRQIDESGGMQGGRGLAIAGIVLGWIGAGFLVLMAVALAVMLIVALSTAP
jgi:Domain of unknown function (DUF4190)